MHGRHALFLKKWENPVSKALYFSTEPWKPLFRSIPRVVHKPTHFHEYIENPIWHFRQNADFWSSSLEGSLMLPQAETRLEMHCAAR
jgi:hypothetical protein